MSVDDLIAVVSGREPANDAWRSFLETPEGKTMSEPERRLTARFVPRGEPTVSSYRFALAAVRSGR